ncbi:MAG: hypothetical protein HY307_01885 [Arcobacter sp.]|nr:hypothetical protein [Arcobacter sp.]
MIKFINFIFIFIITVIFTACGGGGGGTSPADPQTTNINGIAVDNYISGATVCIDTNKNNFCDAKLGKYY